MVYSGKWNRNVILIMKLTTILTFLVFTFCAGKLYAQDVKFTFSFNNVQVKEVFEEIENTSDFVLLYNEKVVDIKREISIEVEDKTIETVLNKLFRNSTNTFKIYGKQIVILDKISLEESKKKQVKNHKEIFNISGKVTNWEGESIAGVTIVVKDEVQGTVTAPDGSFVIPVSTLPIVLRFSFVGLRTQEITVIDSETPVNVEMEIDAIGIGEVLAIGYGKKAKAEITNSVASVKGEVLAKSSSSIFDQALQGKVAGVRVMANSGQPGSATSTRIRGTSSLMGNNEPLYIIDGIQIQGINEGVLFVSSGNATNSAMRSSPLSTINPSDIESIEILKDASAAAIYGNRGANGVIIITTKRGRNNQFKVDYEFSSGTKQINRRVDVLNLSDYAEYNNEQALVQGRPLRPEFANPALLSGGTDWQNLLFSGGYVNTHNLSITGGGKKHTFFVSGNYTDDNGPMAYTWMKRYAFRANIDSKINNWIQFGNNFSLGDAITRYGLSTTYDGPIVLSLMKAPDIRFRDEHGNYIGVEPGQEVPRGGLSQANPVALSEQKISEKEKFSVYNNLYLELLFGDFKFRSEFNFTGDFSHNTAFYGEVEYAGYSNEPSQLREQQIFKTGYDWKNFLYYNKAFGKHNVDAMFGHEARQENYRYLGGEGGGFYDNNLNSLSLSDVGFIRSSGSRDRLRQEAYISRVFYNYNNLAMLTASLRADGSPNFAKEYRWGYFPSVSAAFRFSHLRYFKEKLSAINNLKISGSWGKVGNDNVLGGQFRPLVDITPLENGGFSTTFITYDPHLRWEETQSLNLGLEIGFWQNRINFQTEIYSKKTIDALNMVLLPPSVGTGIRKVSNIASVSNKGFEISLNTQNINRELEWKMNITFTLNRNEILDLGEGGLPLYGTYSKSEEGGPIGRFWGYKTNGLYQDLDDILLNARWNGVNTIDANTGMWLGDYKFLNISNSNAAEWLVIGYKGDTDSDGNYIPGTAVYTGNMNDEIRINNADVINTDDQMYIGNPNPDFSFGFNNTFKYKNFDLTIYSIGVVGNDIYNGLKSWMLRVDQYNQNTLQIVNNRARLELSENGNSYNIADYSLINPNAEVPRLRNDFNFSMASNNSRFVERGSYFRIQNIELGYTLPKKWINKIKLTDTRIYFNAQNPLTVTNYSGWDPETGNLRQSSLNAGVDRGRYPLPKVFKMGIKIGL